MKRDLYLAQKTNLFFLAIFALLALFHINRLEDPLLILSLYGGLIIIQMFIYIKRFSTNSVFIIIRDIVFPAVSILIVFDSLTALVPAVNPKDIDHLLIKLDFLLFNSYPTLFMEKIQSRFLTDLFMLGYSSYYFLPLILGASFKINGRETQFQKGLFLILLCFYLSYIGYFFFPALGPRYTMLHLYQTELKGYFLYETINPILNSIEGIKRDAFPSGHTAITLVVLHLAYKYHRKLFFYFLPLTVLLLISTVYGRYHYVIDVLGGIGLYIFTMLAGEFLWRRFVRQ